MQSKRLLKGRKRLKKIEKDLEDKKGCKKLTMIWYERKKLKKLESNSKKFKNIVKDCKRLENISKKYIW